MFFSIFFLCMIYACSRLVCWFWRVSWWVMIRTTVWHHWFGVQAVQAEERQIGSRQFCAGLRALRFEGWSLKSFKTCVEQSKVELANGSCRCLQPHFLRHILRHIFFTCSFLGEVIRSCCFCAWTSTRSTRWREMKGGNRCELSVLNKQDGKRGKKDAKMVEKEIWRDVVFL